MKFKKAEENHLLYSLKNMRISNKKRRHIQKNIHIGAKLFAIPNNENLNKLSYNYKSYYRPISLNVSRYRRLSAQEGADNCSPTRAYHSDSETVVKKEKESTYRSQKNLLSENEINFTCILQNDNVTPFNVDLSDYLSSDFSYPLVKEHHLDDIYHTVTNSNNNSNNITYPEIPMKRFSLRESSTSLFGSNLIDPTKSTNVERSPSLQHIGCSSIDASPFFRTPMSTISGNCDQLTATTTSSRVSCSSGYSHSGIFNAGYSSDDFHLLHHNNTNNHNINPNLRTMTTNFVSNANNGPSVVTGIINKRGGDPFPSSYSSSWISGNNRNVIQSTNLSNQPHILSLDVDLPRQQNNVLNSGDSTSGTDDLSAYMDLMIHIPKMHL